MMAEETQYRENFRAALRRLTREIDNLRTEQAAIAAYQEAQPPKNRFLVVAFIGMLGDRLLRLIRILEDGGDAASFWYLYRCAPHRMKTLDEAWLRNFSGKLKAVRNVTFVHLDKKGIALDENGIAEAVAVWKRADITESDIARVIETVRCALYDLWLEEFGKPPIPIGDSEDPRSYNPDLDRLKALMKESIADLIDHRS